MTMSRADQRISRRFLAFFLTTFMALWVGGSILTDLVLIPTAFRMLPREHAVTLGAEAYRQLNILECLLGAASVLIAFAFGRLGWGTMRRHRIATSLTLGMTVIALVFLLYLTPYITGKAEGLLTAGVDLSDPTLMPPDREDLHTAHLIYALLDGLKISAGIAIFWLLSTRKRT